MGERRIGPQDPGWSKAVEGVMSPLIVGEQLGRKFVYDHEVREALRLVGYPLDRNLPDLPAQYEWEFDKDYEPDFEPEEGIEETKPEEESPDAQPE